MVTELMSTLHGPITEPVWFASSRCSLATRAGSSPSLRNTATDIVYISTGGTYRRDIGYLTQREIGGEVRWGGGGGRDLLVREGVYLRGGQGAAVHLSRLPPQRKTYKDGHTQDGQ